MDGLYVYGDGDLGQCCLEELGGSWGQSYEALNFLCFTCFEFDLTTFDSLDLFEDLFLESF